MTCFELLFLAAAIFFIGWQGLFYWHWWHMEKPKKFDAKEIVLNSLGSIAGWTAGYFLLFFRLNHGFAGFDPNLTDLVIFLIAFYGMSGYLPHVLIIKLHLGK